MEGGVQQREDWMESIYVLNVHCAPNRILFANKSENRGWISIARGNKASRLFTIPRSKFKSSAKDFAPEMLHLSSFQSSFRTAYGIQGEPIVIHLRFQEKNIIASSTDSDLEAFSHNPADDSFAALAVQPTALPAIWTNGSSRTKLD